CVVRTHRAGVTGALRVIGAVWCAGRRIRHVVSFAETVSRSRLVGRVRCRASARGVTGFRQALPTPPATRGVEVHCVLGVAALVDGGADESLGVVGSFVELLERRLAREAAFQIVDCGRHVVGCVVTREFLQCGGVAAADAVPDVLRHGPCRVGRHAVYGSPCCAAVSRPLMPSTTSSATGRAPSSATRNPGAQNPVIATAARASTTTTAATIATVFPLPPRRGDGCWNGCWNCDC